MSAVAPIADKCVRSNLAPFRDPFDEVSNNPFQFGVLYPHESFD